MAAGVSRKSLAGLEMAAVFAALSAVLFNAGVAHAQASDLISTPACRSARVELEAALDDASAKRSRTKRLDAARSRAAAACFGESPGAPRTVTTQEPPPGQAPNASQSQSQPQSAPIPGLAARLANPPSSIPAQPLPPSPPSTAAVLIPRANILSNCDAGGCWDSDGRRVNQVGPVLMGPRGACIAQGTVVTCP